MNSLEQNKALYRQFIETIFNRGETSRIAEFLAPSYKYHNDTEGSSSGPDSVVQIVKSFRTAFPDLKIEILSQIADGDLVVSRAITRGTHEGPLFGNPASHRSVSMSGITWVRIASGKIVESWVENNVFGLMKQIGAVPAEASH